MKTLFGRFASVLAGLIFLVACSEPQGIITKEDTENNNGNPRLDRPQTIFEGEWLWIKTEGEGIAGPYTSDSTSTGYSLRYNFDWNTVVAYKGFLLDMGPVDLVEKTGYQYSYVISEDSTQQVLTVTDSTGNAETFLWNIKTDERDNTTVVTMTLKNTEACCDNVFTQYFIRTKENIIESK